MLACANSFVKGPYPLSDSSEWKASVGFREEKGQPQTVLLRKAGARSAAAPLLTETRCFPTKQIGMT